MEEMTLGALASLIITFCKITKENVDNPETVKCYEFMLNCSVNNEGKIFKKRVDQCKKDYK